MLENPYSLHPATGKNFIGRTDILNAWRKRLTPDGETWKSAKSWMVVGAGGMGKTSLLHELNQIAKDEFKAHTISIDLGQLREIGDTDDLFATLSIEMPKAKKPGTKLRKWFGLQPNAPFTDLVGQITGELINQVTGFGIGLAGGGVKIGNFRQKSSELEGTAHRLAQFLVNLVLLSEEQNSAVIVLLDQVGKCHDHPTWAYIAEMFLVLSKKMRYVGASQIFFVISLRPEREGLLRNIVDRRLFEKDLFDFVDLHPLSSDQAIEAIVVRGQPYINSNLARRIVSDISDRGPLDPYTIQLASMAVWNYLLGGEQQRSSKDLESNSEKLNMIIRQGHVEITRPFIQNPIQWNILIILSQSQGGLTITEIHSRLSGEHNLSTSGVISDISQLLNPPLTGYRLLTEIRGGNSLNRYVIAHDLLRDYIISLIPDDQRLINQAKRILEYGVWRYRETNARLSDWELNILWGGHPHINFTPEQLEVIIDSELLSGTLRILDWYKYYPQEIKKTVRSISPSKDKDRFDFRVLLYIYYNDPLLKDAQILVSILAKNENKDVRLRATETLGRLGEPALSILTELARNVEDRDVRLRATETLGELGEPALSILTELARNVEDRDVRLRATETLGELGEPALSILTELARNVEDRDVRLRATETLGELGEPALPILVELFRDTEDSLYRLRVEKILGQVIENLGQVGNTETVLPFLAELAKSAKDKFVRLPATVALGRLGDTETALPFLAELAKSAENRYDRLRAMEALGQLGDTETALSLLTELAKSAENRYDRLRAMEALGRLGNTETALSLLAGQVRNGDNNLVRLRAMEALGRLGGPALSILTEFARSVDDKDIRRWATHALTSSGEATLPLLAELAKSVEDNGLHIRVTESPEPLEYSETTLPLLVELAKSVEDDGERLRVAKGLGLLGDTETALPLLAELARNAEKRDVRLRAIELLERLGEPALPLLAELAKSVEDDGERLRVAEGLGLLGDTETALPLLAELAKSAKDKFVRLRATRNLGGLGEPASPLLAELAKSAENKEVSLQATKSLGEIGQPVLPLLAELAKKADNHLVRLRAIELLGGLGEPALPLLAELAKSAENKEVSLQATKSLGEIGQSALPLLAELAKRADNHLVRLRAIELLGGLGEPALPLLAELAKSVEDNGERLRVAEGLGLLGDTETALPLLAELAKSAENQFVRLRARDALEKLGESGLMVLADLVRKSEELNHFTKVDTHMFFRLRKINNQKLLAIATINPFDKIGGNAALALINNLLLEVPF